MTSDTRCSVCYAEWNAADIEKAKIQGCPHCRTTLAPMLIKHDGYIQINWQELRMLAIYSRRWLDLYDKSLNPQNKQAEIALLNILRKLSRYQPQGAATIVPDQDPGRIPVEVLQMIRQIGKPKQEAEKPEFTFEIKNEDLRPNENGQIPSPFIKKKK